MVPTAPFCGFPQDSNQAEFHPGKLQRGAANMMVSKWLDDEKLDRNFSLRFELSSFILESMNCEIRMKMRIKIEILSFQVAGDIFIYWSIGFMIKMLI